MAVIEWRLSYASKRFRHEKGCSLNLYSQLNLKQDPTQPYYQKALHSAADSLLLVPVGKQL